VKGSETWIHHAATSWYSQAAKHSAVSGPVRRDLDRCDMESVRYGKIDPAVRSVRVVVALVDR
jgi:hypothetical protein